MKKYIILSILITLSWCGSTTSMVNNTSWTSSSTVDNTIDNSFNSHSQSGALRNTGVNLKEECNKIINGEKSQFLSDTAPNLISTYKDGIKFYSNINTNDLYKGINSLHWKSHQDGVSLLQSKLAWLDKSTIAYISISDALNDTQKCSKVEKNASQCTEQSNIIKNTLLWKTIDASNALTSNYETLFFSLKDPLKNFLEEYNKIFTEECQSLK